VPRFRGERVEVDGVHVPGFVDRSHWTGVYARTGQVVNTN
jgi:hypothetical protein